MTMAYIRNAYGVPAKRFARVRFQGQDGSIVGTRYQYLKVRLDAEKTIRVIHPTWEVEYLDPSVAPTPRKDGSQ